MRSYWRRSFRFIKLHRIACAVMAGVLLVALFASSGLGDWLMTRPAVLSDQELKLVGDIRDDAKDNLKFDSKTKSYSFAIEANPEADGDASEHTGRVNDAYSAEFATDPKQGVSVTDKATKITVSTTPKFFTASARKQADGHIIYNSEKGKLAYSLKYNGLKENIILSEAPRDDAQTFEFDLKLPAGVEARLETSGDIGIYSADTTLFGDVSYGSDQDRETLEKARQNGQKTNLLMQIPYPVVLDSSGKEYTDKARFELGTPRVEKAQSKDKNLPADAPASMTSYNIYSLVIHTNNLEDLQYPIAIDPTMRVTSTSDFTSTNLEAGTEIDTTNNLIKRTTLTGGYLNSWGSDTSIPVAHFGGAAAYTNGFLYFLGGNNGGNDNEVYVTKVTSSGSFTSPNLSGCSGATWCTTSSFTTGRARNGALAYNGYVYVLGGVNAALLSDVQKAKVNSDGSLTSFSAVSTMNQGRQSFAYAVANGFMYVFGGNDLSNRLTSVEKAQINPDGTLQAWSTSGVSALPIATRNLGAVIYNNWVYLVAGNGTTDTSSTIISANINSDGTLGSWVTSSSTLISSRGVGHGVAVMSGYLYVYGGCGDELCGTPRTTSEYASINADGSLSVFRASTTHTTRWLMGYAQVNNKIFSVGGCNSTPTTCGNAIATVVTATVTPAGTSAVSRTESNTFTTSRWGNGTVVANGYIYVIGGCTTDACNSNGVVVATSYYAQISATTGAIGTWSPGASIPSARGHTTAVYNQGYIYVIGGNGPCGNLGAYANNCAQTYYSQITISTGVMGAFQTGNALPDQRAKGAAASYGNYIYYIGGRDSSNAITNTTYYATAGSGSNGTWNSGGTLVTQRELLAATAANGFVYVGTGYNGTINPTTVEISTINTATGALGNFSNTSATILARDGGSLQAYNGFLYIIGGFNGTPLYSTAVEYASINPVNGALGSVTTSPNGLQVGARRMSGAGGIYNGTIYIAGGETTGATMTNSVDSIPINNGGPGNLATWVSVNSMATARTSHVAAAVNGYIYAIGGCTVDNSCGSVTTSVEKAQIQADGTLGSWTTSGVAALPSAHRDMAVAVKDNIIYVTGGCNSSCNSNVVLSGTVNSSGGIASWTSQTGFTNARRSHQSLVVGDYLYILAGVGASLFSDVQVTRIGGAGTLSSPGLSGCGGAIWCTTTSLPVAMRNFTATSAGGYIYTLGGCTDPGDCNNNITKDIYSTQVATDGTLGSWTKVGTTMYSAHSRDAVVSNGYVYIFGGFPVTNIYVEYAPLLTSGGVGNFDRTASPGLLNSVRAVSSNGNLYGVGGNTGTAQTTVNRAVLQSIPRIGSFSKYYDFGSGAAVQPTKLITRGTKQSNAKVALTYMNNNNTGTVWSNTQTNSSISYTSANALTISLGSSTTLSRYLWLCYTVDDTLSAIFPDSSNSTTITDFDLYFHGNPSKRLRGGRTFTNSADRGLDAQ